MQNFYSHISNLSSQGEMDNHSNSISTLNHDRKFSTLKNQCLKKDSIRSKLQKDKSQNPNTLAKSQIPNAERIPIKVNSETKIAKAADSGNFSNLGLSGRFQNFVQVPTSISVLHPKFNFLAYSLESQPTQFPPASFDFGLSHTNGLKHPQVIHHSIQSKRGQNQTSSSNLITNTNVLSDSNYLTGYKNQRGNIHNQSITNSLRPKNYSSNNTKRGSTSSSFCDNSIQDMQVFNQNSTLRMEYTAVVLPTNGLQYEIKIPEYAASSKLNLFSFLKKTKIFELENEIFEGENSEVFLGIYWREVFRNYRSAPQTAMIFRYSNGIELQENFLCQQWRKDVERVTYGTIVLVNLQYSESVFQLASFDMNQYELQLKKRMNQDTVTTKHSRESKMQRNLVTKHLNQEFHSEKTKFRLKSSPLISEIQGLDFTYKPDLPSHVIFKKSSIRNLLLEGKHNLDLHIETYVNLFELEQWNTKRLRSSQAYPILYNYILHTLHLSLGCTIESEPYFLRLFYSNFELIVVNSGLKSRINNIDDLFIVLKHNENVSLEIFDIIPWKEVLTKYEDFSRFKSLPARVNIKKYLKYPTITSSDNIALNLYTLNQLSRESNCSIFPSTWNHISEAELECLGKGFLLQQKWDQSLLQPAYHLDSSADKCTSIQYLPLSSDQNERCIAIALLRCDYENDEDGDTSDDGINWEARCAEFRGVIATSFDHAYCASRIIEKLDPESWLSVYMKEETCHYIEIELGQKNENMDEIIKALHNLFDEITPQLLGVELYCFAIRNVRHDVFIILPYITTLPSQIDLNIQSIETNMAVVPSSGLAESTGLIWTQLGDCELLHSLVNLLKLNVQKTKLTEISIMHKQKKDTEFCKPGLLTSDLWYDPLTSTISNHLPKYNDYFINGHCNFIVENRRCLKAE